MTDKEPEKDYPVKTTHEFLSEMNHEWGRFKRGAIFSTIVSSILLVAFVFVFWRTAKNGFEVSDLILELLLAGFLVYTIYLMAVQYRFFRRWEGRMTRIFSYEEKLLSDDEPKETAK